MNNIFAPCLISTRIRKMSNILGWLFYVIIAYIGKKSGALVQWLRLPVWKLGDLGFEPHSGLQVLKKQNVSSLLTRKDSMLWGTPHDRKLACSASDRQGSSFKFCVWRALSSQSSHHPQKVLLAQFSLHMHNGGLKHHSFHFNL